MFRSSTILRELVQSLAKVTLLLKHSVKLRSCILCGDVAACREMACVLLVVQTAVFYVYIVHIDSPSLLYDGYRVFPGGKVWPGRAADHSPPSSVAVMEE